MSVEINVVVDESIDDVVTKSSYLAKLGELYVERVDLRYNTVTLCSSRGDADDELKDKEVLWLRRNISGIVIKKIKITVEELEVSETEELLF